MPFMRRRPLLRVAAVGGVAYMGAKAGANKAQQNAQGAQQTSGRGSSCRRPATPCGSCTGGFGYDRPHRPVDTVGETARLRCADRRGVCRRKGKSPRLTAEIGGSWRQAELGWLPDLSRSRTVSPGY